MKKIDNFVEIIIRCFLFCLILLLFFFYKTTLTIKLIFLATNIYYSTISRNNKIFASFLSLNMKYCANETYSYNKQIKFYIISNIVKHNY